MSSNRNSIKNLDKLNFSYNGHIKQIGRLKSETENTFVIYDRKTNRVGTICNSIADFGRSATPIMSFKNIITFGTVKEYLDYIADLANNHRRLLTLDQYAEEWELRKTDVRRFCATSYAHVLGVRQLVVNNRSIYSIPETLHPESWSSLRIQGKRSYLRMDIVEALGTGSTTFLKLADKLSPPYSKEVLRKTITSLVSHGIITKDGRGDKARIALA